MNSWDKKFIELVEHISGWSKDRSTKIGSVMVDSDNRIVSVGYNGFPSGFDDNIDYRHERPQKYLYTEHSERNCIYNAARIGAKTKDCILYVKWFPCADCARAIIQSGIKKLYCQKPDFSTNKNQLWKVSFDASLEMLTECGIEIIYY